MWFRIERENDNNRPIKNGEDVELPCNPVIQIACMSIVWDMEGETKEKKKRRQKRVLEGPGDSEEVSDMNKMVAKATVFRLFLSLWRCTEM